MEKPKTKLLFFKPIWVLYTVVVLLIAVVLPVFAWFTINGGIAAYAPVSAYESLYIGAGHIDITNDSPPEFTPNRKIEDVRYLYLEGVDLTNEDKDYYDYVFCVYGTSITSFYLQLGYTTNNQFTYKVFNAAEASVISDGAIAYKTHDENYPATYYYKAVGDEIPGTYVNKTTSADDKTIADETKHDDTYGEYDEVNRFAEPIYWQTSSAISTGVSRGAFVNYFILRVYKGEKSINDRETDVICIAVKSSS